MSKSQRRLDRREFTDYLDTKHWNIDRKVSASKLKEKRMASALKTKNVKDLVHLYDDEYGDD